MGATLLGSNIPNPRPHLVGAQPMLSDTRVENASSLASRWGPNINMELLERAEATNKETLGKGQHFPSRGVQFLARAGKTVRLRAQEARGNEQESHRDGEREPQVAWVSLQLS
ncbi:uncharacterized protein LOC143653209 [Tamandua tetradactyla]|uniref:uncharacterized protein LOC143653209 n=1 Tax=Tamandua tetradactyla TaxID=48850 RepID=UPI00405462C4